MKAPILFTGYTHKLYWSIKTEQHQTKNLNKIMRAAGELTILCSKDTQFFHECLYTDFSYKVV